MRKQKEEAGNSNVWEWIWGREGGGLACSILKHIGTVLNSRDELHFNMLSAISSNISSLVLV